MKLLFVGDDWLGSNARSLREALERQPGVQLVRVDTERRPPVPRGLPTRAALRLTGPVRNTWLQRQVKRTAARFEPDAIIFYKGAQFSAGFLRRLSGRAMLVNCFPDYSPHAYGASMQAAMGVYDLVVSTKPYHPPNWGSIYGYENRCVFVPHGYDPVLHLRDTPAEGNEYDVVLVAAGRPEYFELVRGLAREFANEPLRVGIGGNGWAPVAADLPAGWKVFGPRFGDGYVDLLRKGAVVIAPVQRDVRVSGVVQPGDEDTARTYEIAAACCFFIHQRTEFVQQLYAEDSEAPFFSDATELAAKIRLYLRDARERHRIATAAHARAVPSYSLDARARELLGHLGWEQPGSNQ